MATRIYNYDKLVGEANRISFTDAWVEILVPDLTPGDFYVMPMFFWSPKAREATIKIYTPGTEQVVFSRTFAVGSQKDTNGNYIYTTKRYKLNEERHNGTAWLALGGSTGPLNQPLHVYFGELTSKVIRQRNLRDDGKCPTCGEAGYWHAMAMLCKEHGVFIG